MNQSIKDQIAYNIMHNGSKRIHYCKNCGCAKGEHQVIDRRTGKTIIKNRYYDSIYAIFGACKNDSCNHFERAFI